MCDPRNAKTYQKYEGCGHRLPKDACDFYSNEHLKCYEPPDVAKDVPCYTWTQGETFEGKCRFCQEGKDIDHDSKYGKGWAGRKYFT